jgi:hypothetical protein
MDLGLLHGFITVNFLWLGSLAPNQNSNLKDHGLHFVWPLPYDLSGMGVLLGAYAPASITLCVIGTRKAPLLVKAVVLEEESITTF